LPMLYACLKGCRAWVGEFQLHSIFLWFYITPMIGTMKTDHSTTANRRNFTMSLLSYDFNLTCVHDYQTLKYHVKEINGVVIDFLVDKYPTHITIYFTSSGLSFQKWDTLSFIQFNLEGLIGFLTYVSEQNPNSFETIGKYIYKDHMNTPNHLHSTVIKQKEEIYKSLVKPTPICIQLSEAGYDYLHSFFHSFPESAAGMGAGDILHSIKHEGGWSVQIELQDVLKAVQRGFLLPEHVLNWRRS
jgi:hypothetical protein